MKKIIKKSCRGLTFSFEGENTKFNIGNKYRYIIEPKSNKVYIVPSTSEKSLKISKKKVGNKIKSLIDLRAKLIVENFNNVELLEISIEKNTIIISALKEITTYNSKQNITSSKKSNKVIDLKKRLQKTKKISEIRVNKSLLNKISGDEVNFPLESILSTLDNELYTYSSEETESLSEGLNYTIKVLSVFSGIGMFDYPLFKDKTFEIVKAIEINKSACETYKKNIGEHIINENIRNFKIEEDNKYDLLYGGPPCKPFSNANRINSNRLDKHQDIDLLDEYIRILKSHKHFKAFVIENVPQVITSNKGKYLDNLKEKLEDFDISYIILKDNECGGYTTRKRAFIFGSKIGKVSLAYIKKLGKTVGDALKKVNEKWFNFNDITIPNRETKERMSYVPPGGNWIDIPKDKWLPSFKIGKTHSNTYKRLALDNTSITLANYRKCNLIHPTENRGISVAEALAISGFDNYKVLGSLADKQQSVSNGVPFYLGLTVKNIIKNLFLKHFKKLSINM